MIESGHKITQGRLRVQTKKWIIPFLFIVLGSIAKDCGAQTYFPPLIGNTWEQEAYADFPYDSTFTDSLLSFLDSRNTKAFIVVHNGRIVNESYFGTFGADSFWYWASAGKSLSSFLCAQARDQGILNASAPVAQYLGNQWSSCTPEQETEIKVWNLLSMTSGLDPSVPDPDCTDPSCLKYKGAPGTLWYYHNAPYYLSHQVLEAASGKSLQSYMTQNLSSRTGITGLWAGTLFISKARSAARFGHLMLNQGIWNGDTLIRKKDFFDSLVISSQNLNPAYGLLVWLNGKDTLMLPGSSLRLPGKLNTEAPDDMYACLGKNDQKIYVVPSQNLVIVRLGEDAGDGLFGPSAFDALLWKHINRWRQVPTGWQRIETEARPYPNPCDQWLQLSDEVTSFRVFGLDGKVYLSGTESQINTGGLPSGYYILEAETPSGPVHAKIQVQH
ncbi:MAG: serine hydrolase [Bacteroidota bacterium]|nr:serine hydrolase [Bacteroidota bacterium]MDX5430074.1 serine hydrolase [Bacteroidota bacterium]MDX5468838.1 serine hydrolase [Bacteroidota bacterium]